MPWDRRQDEPAPAYARFLIYRNLGPRRSLAQAQEVCGVSLGRLKQLSGLWSWPARALAWDKLRFKQQRQKELADYQESHQRILKEAQDWQRIARAQLFQWVRRDANGQLQLIRELTPTEAMRLWLAGSKAELQLRGGLATPTGNSQTYEVFIENFKTKLRDAERQISNAFVSAGASSYRQSEIERAIGDVLIAWVLWLCKDDEYGITKIPLWPWDIPFSSV